MADNSDRIVKWIQGAGGESYELSCRGELIEAYPVDGDLTLEAAEQVYADLDSAAEHDCAGADRPGTRVYQITAITGEFREICPLRIRKVSENSASRDKLVSDLHKILLKRDKYVLEALTKMNSTLMKSAERNEKRNEEFLIKLESVRSQELERKIAYEEHEHRKELKDRVVNAAVPAMLAVAAKFTNGSLALPAPDMRHVQLIEISKSLSDTQIDILCKVIEEPEFGNFLADCTEGKVNLDYFKGIVRGLTADQAASVFGCLNPGQQGSLATVIEALG